jgi:hypothetical protein
MLRLIPLPRNAPQRETQPALIRRRMQHLHVHRLHRRFCRAPSRGDIEFAHNGSDDESRFNQGEAGLGQHQLVPRWPLYRGLVSLLLGNQSDSLLPGTAPESMRKWLERELAASARSYMETSEYHNHNHLLLRCHLVEPSLGSEF